MVVSLAELPDRMREAIVLKDCQVWTQTLRQPMGVCAVRERARPRTGLQHTTEAARSPRIGQAHARNTGITEIGLPNASKAREIDANAVIEVGCWNRDSYEA